MLFALLALQVAAVHPEADRAVLDAFKEVCWGVPELREIREAANKHGWTVVQKGKHVKADHLRTEMEGAATASYSVQIQQFVRTIDDRVLLLTINRGELNAQAANRFGSTICQVQELSEALPLNLVSVRNWMGRDAEEATQNQDGALFQSWYSILTKDPTIVVIGYIPPGSELAGPEKMFGIYLSAEAYGDETHVNSR